MGATPFFTWRRVLIVSAHVASSFHKNVTVVNLSQYDELQPLDVRMSQIPSIEVIASKIDCLRV